MGPGCPLSLSLSTYLLHALPPPVPLLSISSPLPIIFIIPASPINSPPPPSTFPLPHQLPPPRLPPPRVDSPPCLLSHHPAGLSLPLLLPLTPSYPLSLSPSPVSLFSALASHIPPPFSPLSLSSPFKIISEEGLNYACVRDLRYSVIIVVHS